MSLLTQHTANFVQGKQNGGSFQNLVVHGSLQLNAPLTVSMVSAQPPPYVTPSLYFIVEVDGRVYETPMFENVCPGAYADSTWPHCRGPSGNLNTGLTLAVKGPVSVASSWLSTLDGVDFDCAGSSPVIGPGGTIYIMSGTALNAVAPDGTFKWAFPTNNSFYSVPCVGTDGTVYCQNNTSLFAITPPVPPQVTPTLKWEATIGDGNDTNPLIGCDGTIYAGTGTGLFAIDGDTGVVKWQNLTLGNCNGWSRAIEKSVIYIHVSTGVYALDTATGSTLWSNLTTGYGLYSMPVVDTNGLYVGSNNGLYKLNKATGAVIWEVLGDAVSESSPALYGNLVIVSPTNQLLSAFNATTGALVWTVAGNNNQNSPSVDAAGRVYVIDYSTSSLKAFDAETGAPLWTDAGPTTGTNNYSNIAVSSNVLYIGTQTGLYAAIGP